MTYEAVIVERYSHPSDYTVADGNALAKGALLGLTTPRTAAALVALPAAGSNKAGIAAREKVASDGRTNLAVYEDGKFFCYVSGGGVAGQFLGAASDIATYPNHLMVVNSGGTINASGGQVFAKLLQTCSAGALNQVLVQLVDGA